jgi:integrase
MLKSYIRREDLPPEELARFLRVPERWLLEPQQVLLRDTLPYYESWLAERKRRPKGVARYRWGLRRFIEWLEKSLERPATIADVYPEVVEAYAAFLTHEKRASSTIINSLAVLKSHSYFLMRKRLRGDDPTVDIERPTRKRPDPDPLDEEEMRLLLQAIEPVQNPRPHYDRHQYRNRLAVIIFLFTGMRLSEVSVLKWRHIRFALNVIRVQLEDENQRDGPKNGRSRQIPLHPTLKRILLEVPLSERRPDLPVIPKDDGEHLSDRGMERVINRWLERRLKQMLDNQAFPIWSHRFRTTLACGMVIRGENLRIIQEVLGHAHISSTEHYVKADNRSKQEAISRMPSFGL